MSDQLPEQTVSDTDKIQAPSIPSLKDEFGNQAVKIGRKLKGRPLGKGDLLNALVTWFLFQDMDKRAEFIADGLERFEQILAGKLVLAVDDESHASRPEGLGTAAPREGRQSKSADEPKPTRRRH